MLSVRSVYLDSDIDLLIDRYKVGEIRFVAKIDQLQKIEFGYYHLLREWNIWFKCFGKVLIVNGSSSSGKTSLGLYLSNLGFNLITADNLIVATVFDQHVDLIMLAKQKLIREAAADDQRQARPQSIA